MSMMHATTHLVNEYEYARMDNVNKIMALEAERARVKNYLSKLDTEMKKQAEIKAKGGSTGSVFSRHTIPTN